MRQYQKQYKEMKRSALRRGLRVTLTYSQFKFLTNITECHYCEAEIDWSNKRRYNLDRKVNRNGYHIDNVVVCCTKCNRLKGTEFKYSEYKRLAKKIRKVVK